VKVVTDCIHCSKVKEMGLKFLDTTSYISMEEGCEEGGPTMMLEYAKLTEAQITRFQAKLARGIVIFMELLHLMIVRNRDMLLAVVQARKQEKQRLSSNRNNGSSPPSPIVSDRRKNKSSRGGDTASIASDSHSLNQDGSIKSGSRHRSDNDSRASARKIDRTVAPSLVQRELERSFISMAKVLHPIISKVIRSETPRWLKSCCVDSYFSSKTYRQTRLSMGEELFFFGDGNAHNVQEEQAKSTPLDGTELSFLQAFCRNGSPSGSFSGSITSRSTHQTHQREPSQSSVPVALNEPSSAEECQRNMSV